MTEKKRTLSQCNVKEMRIASLKPQPCVAEAQDIARITLRTDGVCLVSLETEWRDGTVKSHGRQGAPDDLSTTTVELRENEFVTKVGIRCLHGERHSHINSMTIHTTLGMRTGWIGGAGGDPRFLEKEGHKVVGFTGRAGHVIDATGVLTLPLGTTLTSSPERGPVFGGPSGVAFSDWLASEQTQLAPFVIRGAFKNVGGAPPPKSDRPAAARGGQVKEQRFLESARQMFTNMRNFIDSQQAHCAFVDLASEYFGTSFAADGSFYLSPKTPISPMVTWQRAKVEDHPLKRHIAHFRELCFDRYDPEFVFTEDYKSIACHISAGWRSCLSNVALPVSQWDGIELQVLVEELRIVALGLCSVDRPESYAGCDDSSIAVQSTGHVAINGELHPGPAFSDGDVVTLYVTKTDVTFSVNGGAAYGPFPLPMQTPFLCVSTYLGPNTVTLLGCTLWSNEAAALRNLTPAGAPPPPAQLD
ncbi:hypothetical protein DIPPA_31507 [Diplonema papillatum]|nr:hypothetical protein DIPPA_31507 [Diplonema papillatum]